MADVSNPRSKWPIPVVMLIALFALGPLSAQSQDGKPVADAGLSRYVAQAPIVLDGTGSYDPDDSGPLSYAWQQLSGPLAVISDADTAMPTISGLVQTDEIQECEFELVVNDGELTSRPHDAKVIIVPDFGEDLMRHANPPFDPSKPTLIFFPGGDCVIGFPGYPVQTPILESKANVIDFPDGYVPDKNDGSWHTYYRCADMIIVYLSSVAPDYRMPIQTVGFSTGGQPAVDVGIRLNLTYRDTRYAVNRVTLEDASTYCRGSKGYSESIAAFIASSVDGEQCWLDNYVSKDADFYPNVLNVGFDQLDHVLAWWWYDSSWTNAELNKFNDGVVAGAYWSVIGPGKNLQLTPTQDTQTYKFKWYGDISSGYMDFWDESNYPGRLPQPVTLEGPEHGSFVDDNGAVLSCEESEDAVGYQLLFGLDPYHLVYLFSDTSSPPSEIVTTFPFRETWWTVKIRGQYGSTIYPDPIRIYAEDVEPKTIENVTIGKEYGSIQDAIDDARSGDEIVVSDGIWQENINFKGKSLTVRSASPNDPVVVAATVIHGNNQGLAVTFSSGEDSNCVLAGFTITGGTRGIYCSGASPTIVNCTVSTNGNADMGAGMYLKDGSSPRLVNCTFSENSASMMGGRIHNENSSPILIDCTFSGNSATYLGGDVRRWWKPDADRLYSLE